MMNNNEISNINENNIFHKFKIMLLKLKEKLFKNKSNQEVSNKVSEIKNINVKNEFYEEVKITDNDIISNPFEKEEFIKSLDGNIEALNMLSIERLEKLEEYYQSIIDKNEAEIKRLKMEN